MNIIYSRDFNINRWNSNAIKHIARIGGTFTTPVDRTGNMNTHRYLYDPIPEGETKMTFEDCCYESAEKIWSMDKPVELSWSGGIDSTVVLFSMIETKPNNGIFSIRYTDESIKEFPSLYEKIIKNKYLPTNSVYDTSYYDRTDIIKVSGDCGDGIYGTNHALMLSRHDIMGDDISTIYKWKVEQLYSPSNKNKANREDKNDILESLLEYISYSPVPIRTIFDMYWWVYFNTKWMEIQRMKPIKWSQSLNWRDHISFYNTLNFQRWSITNHDIKFQKKIIDFKKPSKDFIYKHFKDDEYRKYKTIRPSGLEVVSVDDMSPNMIKLLLDDGRFWLKNDIIDESVDMELCYV